MGYYNSPPKYDGFEENHYRQPCAQRYPVLNNEYHTRRYYETAFVKGWDQASGNNKNRKTVLQTDDLPALYRSRTSSVSNMSLSPSQRFVHSSDRRRCSEPG